MERQPFSASRGISIYVERTCLDVFTTRTLRYS